MYISRRVALICLFSLVACAGEGGARESGKPALLKLDYGGPAVQCQLDGNSLAVAIEVHSGGFQLRLLRTAAADGYVRVELELTSPAEGEPVVMAEQTMKLRVALAEGSEPVRVHVRQLQRGVHYLVPPALALAAVVTR